MGKLEAPNPFLRTKWKCTAEKVCDTAPALAPKVALYLLHQVFNIITISEVIDPLTRILFCPSIDQTLLASCFAPAESVPGKCEGSASTGLLGPIPYTSKPISLCNVLEKVQQCVANPFRAK